jgi:rhodanese-related sulfurtransferase
MIAFLKKLFGAKEDFLTLEDKEFQVLMKSVPKPVVIDVRMKHEYNSGKIHNSLNIDFMQPTFLEKVKHFDKEKHYFLYCQSGRRSARACRKMAKLGFKNIVNLKGGILSYSGKLV